MADRICRGAYTWVSGRQAVDSLHQQVDNRDIRFLVDTVLQALNGADDVVFQLVTGGRCPLVVKADGIHLLFKDVELRLVCRFALFFRVSDVGDLDMYCLACLLNRLHFMNVSAQTCVVVLSQSEGLFCRAVAQVVRLSQVLDLTAHGRNLAATGLQLFIQERIFSPELVGFEQIDGIADCGSWS